MQNFENLDSWKKGKELCILCYSAVKNFPPNERFALSDQIRRAAVSVPSNIAEGYSRRSTKELSHFLEISIGSVFEVMTQVSIAEELGYISKDEKEKIYDNCEHVVRLIRGFIKYKKGINE